MFHFQACVGTSQPGSLTDWGSEEVKEDHSKYDRQERENDP